MTQKKKLIKAKASMKNFVAVLIFDSQMTSIISLWVCGFAVMEKMFFIDAFVQMYEGEKKEKSGFLWDICTDPEVFRLVCIPERSSQAHFCTSRCPFLFIIHIYSALTDILIFDIKTSGRNAKMDSTCGVVGTLGFLIMQVNWLMFVLRVLGRERSQRERGSEAGDQSGVKGVGEALFTPHHI